MTVNTLGGDLAGGKARVHAWLPPLVPIAISTFALSALVAYHLRADGSAETRSLLQSAIVGIYEFFGFVPAFLFFLLTLSWSSIWFVTGKLERPVVLFARLCGLVLALAIWVNLRADTGEALPHSGMLGAWIGSQLVSALGTVFSTLLVAPLTLVSLLLATDYFFISYFEGLGARRDAATGESGVEDDVTETFKSLSTVFAPTRATAGAASAARANPAQVAPPVAIEDLAAAIATFEASEAASEAPAAATGEEGAIAEASADLDVDEPPRRVSYFERRQLAARRAAAEAAAQAAAEPAAARLEPLEAPAEAAAGEVVSAPAVPATPTEESDDEFAIAAASLGDVSPFPPVAGSESVESEVASDGGSDRGSDRESVSDLDTEDDVVEFPRGRLAPVASEGDADGSESAPIAGTSADAESILGGSDLLPQPASAAEGDAIEALAGVASESELGQSPPLVSAADDEPAEPVVAIPRPPDGVRQQRLFLRGLDEALVREAVDIVQSSRRASVAMLQRKLRVDYEEALELLAVLAHRGLIDLAEDGTQGRVR